MGQSDFFFCHWYATSSDAIFEALEAAGLNDLMVTMPSEMQRYINANSTTGNKLVNPFDEDGWSDWPFNIYKRERLKSDPLVLN